jgi:hypothetical protein
MPAWVGEPWAPIALVAGVLLHVGLDVTNTYGTAVLSPVSRRRVCTEWVFFIDAVVLVASFAALLLQWLPVGGPGVGPGAVAAGYALFLAVYWAVRAGLYRRARRVAPAGTVSLIPSALAPWRYFGYREGGGGDGDVVVFRLDAVTGRVDGERRIATFDEAFARSLEGLPEYRMMRELSPGYRVIDARPVDGGTRVTCRDLRVRNFGGRFGELTAVVEPGGRVAGRTFHV